MTKQKVILFFPAWYPNRTHLSVGSFIRSHAEALSKTIKVDVLYVCGDENSRKLIDFTVQTINEVETYILYFKKPKSKNFIAQFVKSLLYFVGGFYAYYSYRKLKAKPFIFHIHVLTRAAIVPFILSYFSKIDYFITEHWSRYLPSDNRYQGSFRKWFTQKVVKRSSGISAVSAQLRFYMNQHGLVHANFPVISNVVSDEFLNQPLTDNSDYFIHVSNFAQGVKNVLGILNVFKKLKEEGFIIPLKMVGDGDDFQEAKQFVSLNQLNNVEFTGFVYGNETVKLMNNAISLILFSNYETQSVVIVESLCLGVPVIATKVGGIPEIVNENNGVLIEAQSEQQLYDAILNFKESQFNKTKIKQNAILEFSAQTIANQFVEFYKKGLRFEKF